jgi:hypothetical protein
MASAGIGLFPRRFELRNRQPVRWRTQAFRYISFQNSTIQVDVKSLFPKRGRLNLRSDAVHSPLKH